MDQYLIFRLNEERYAINIQNIREIIEYRRPSELPSAESHVLGLIKIRDEVLTLMDSRAIIDAERTEELEKCKILIFESDKEKKGKKVKVGVVVDDVISVMAIQEDDIKPSPLTGLGIDEENVGYVKGVLNQGEDLIIVVDVEKTKLVQLDDTEESVFA